MCRGSQVVRIRDRRKLINGCRRRLGGAGCTSSTRKGPSTLTLSATTSAIGCPHCPTAATLRESTMLQYNGVSGSHHCTSRQSPLLPRCRCYIFPRAELGVVIVHWVRDTVYVLYSTATHASPATSISFDSRISHCNVPSSSHAACPTDNIGSVGTNDGRPVSGG